MALTLVGLSGFQRGNEAAETGINLETFSCRYYPEFKDFLANYQGQTLGFAIPDKPSREVTIKGEVTGSTGIMATAFATAITFANDVAVFGASLTGGFYLDEITESQSRDGWRSIDGKWTAHPLCA